MTTRHSPRRGASLAGRLARGLAAAALAAAGAASQAQPPPAPGYPVQPVKWVVPYAPGGTTDVIARGLAAAMGQRLAQPVVIDNRPGAASIIGATFIARALPDGYTLGTADSGTLAFNPAMYARLSYDARQDFTFIGGLGRMPLVLAVHPGFPAGTVQELLALARQAPGTISSASSGPGSPLHVALELFKQRTGTDLLHVAYKGSAPGLQDLMAGQVNAMFVDLPPSLSMIRAGKLRVLAVATPQRLSILPDVPTMAEAGVPGFEAYAWQGLVGPAKLPPAVVERVSGALGSALEDPATRARLLGQGIEPMAMSPQQFSAFVQSEQALWAGVIKAARIRLD